MIKKVINYDRRGLSINLTRIKYLSVADSKIYKVTDIDFYNLTIKATGTDLSIADVPENEVFPAESFSEFKIQLFNDSGKKKVIDFEEWVKGHSLKT